jgi:cyclohexyl-isocyanide hydratase
MMPNTTPNTTMISLPAPPMNADGQAKTTLKIAMLIYPQMTALDFIGPNAVFSGLGNVEIYLAWKDKKAVISDTGIAMSPTATFDEVPEDLDVLFVPGGNMFALLADPEVLHFLKSRGDRARYVTSVCTGSLLLGGAGLLTGYHATSHWHVREHLRPFGAIPTAGRVVRDRNRITGGGVTAGLDFGLTVAAELRGEEIARFIQLSLEYDPEPPFDSGSPEKAGAAMVQQFDAMMAQAQI